MFLKNSKIKRSKVTDYAALKRTWNCFESYDNATASNASAAVTLHDRLVRHEKATASKAYVAVTLQDRLVGDRAA